MASPALLCCARDTANFPAEVRVSEDRGLKGSLVRRSCPCSQRCIQIETFCTAEDVSPQEVTIRRTFSIPQIGSRLQEDPRLLSDRQINIDVSGRTRRIIGLIQEDRNWLMEDVFTLLAISSIKTGDCVSIPNLFSLSARAETSRRASARV